MAKYSVTYTQIYIVEADSEEEAIAEAEEERVRQAEQSYIGLPDILGEPTVKLIKE